MLFQLFLHGEVLHTYTNRKTPKTFSIFPIIYPNTLSTKEPENASNRSKKSKQFSEQILK